MLSTHTREHMYINETKRIVCWLCARQFKKYNNFATVLKRLCFIFISLCQSPFALDEDTVGGEVLISYWFEANGSRGEWPTFTTVKPVGREENNHHFRAWIWVQDCRYCTKLNLALIIQTGFKMQTWRHAKSISSYLTTVQCVAQSLKCFDDVTKRQLRSDSVG